MIDSMDFAVQSPTELKAVVAYLKATASATCEQIAEGRNRWLELLHHLKPSLPYRQRTAMAVEMVRQIEAEGQFAQVDDAFDNDLLTIELTRLIASLGKRQPYWGGLSVWRWPSILSPPLSG